MGIKAQNFPYSPCLKMIPRPWSVEKKNFLKNFPESRDRELIPFSINRWRHRSLMTEMEVCHFSSFWLAGWFLKISIARPGFSRLEAVQYACAYVFFVLAHAPLHTVAAIFPFNQHDRKLPFLETGLSVSNALLWHILLSVTAADVWFQLAYRNFQQYIIRHHYLGLSAPH